MTRNDSVSSQAARRTALACMAALAVALGVGRFAFTPLLPLMLHGGGLDLRHGGWLASLNYAGYFVGAFSCAALRAAPARIVRASLAATVLLTIAMGVADEFWVWAVVRFVGGVVSAWAFVFASQWGLRRLAELGANEWSGVIYTGPGFGIIGTGLFVGVAGRLGASAGWIGFGVVSAVMTALVWAVFGDGAGGDEVARRSGGVDATNGWVMRKRRAESGAAPVDAAAHGGSVEAAAHGGSVDAAAHAGSADPAARTRSVEAAAHGGSADAAAYAVSADAAAYAGSADPAARTGSVEAAVHAVSVDAAAHAGSAETAKHAASPASAARSPALSAVRSPLPPRTDALWLVLLYGIPGFGYIITATFLPVIARHALPGSSWPDLFWPMFGVALVIGALSAARLPLHWDNRSLLAVCYLLQAAGIALGIVWPTAPGFAFGSVLIGLPFTAITLFAMREARLLRGDRAAGLMGYATAAYGIGQIVGPLVAAPLAASTGSFSPSLWLAALALVAGAAGLGWRVAVSSRAAA